MTNKSAKKLSCLDKLHLNYVSFVSKSMQKSTLQYYPLVVKMKILAACFRGDDDEDEVPLTVETWVNEMKKVMKSSNETEVGLNIVDQKQKELKRKARDFMQRAEEQDDDALEVYAEVLSRLAGKAKRWSKTNLGETTFIHDRLTDILDCTFGSLNADLFHYEMQDKWMSKASLKPDYLLSIGGAQ
ncbi:hypothetical protein EDC96DRAFT_522800 [Choanephora cucurbitarum]|nr:hypothetical protein EDC96DRAFT_522800 [Choanephora cucurbitarum]